MAVIFYQERLYSDAGFFLGKVVHYETFWYELDRFIRVFSQWLPLLFIKIGMPMKAILIAYSVGHVFFLYAIFLIGRYYYKQYAVVWYLMAIQCMGIHWGFCAPGFELYYVAAILPLFYFELQQNRMSLRQQCMMAVYLFIMLFNYQLSIVLILPLFLMRAYETKWRNLNQYIPALAVAFMTLLIRTLIFSHPYEEAKFEQLLINFMRGDQSWSGYWQPLISFYMTYYTSIWIMVLLISLRWLYVGKRIPALLFPIFLIGVQYIIALTYPEIKHSRYQEQCFYLLVVASCFPLLGIFERMSYRWQWRLSFVFLTVLLLRSYTISNEILPFTMRVDHFNELIKVAQKLPGNKFIMEEGKWPIDNADHSWTTGIETMLLSAQYDEFKTIQIIRDTEWAWNGGANGRILLDSNLYLHTFRSFYERPDSMYNHSEVNTSYYSFPIGPYRLLRGTLEGADSLTYYQQFIQLEGIPRQSNPAGSTITFPVEIANRGDQSLDATKVTISAHWWYRDTLYRWESIRTPLLIDLAGGTTFKQHIFMDVPKDKGDYTMQLDLFVEDSIGWVHCPKRIDMEVY